MPPRYLRKQYPTRLKPCQERSIDTCDTEPTDSCCGVIPCKLCLEWQTYSGTVYGHADFGTSTWSGSVGGGTFTAYWQRNYLSGECEFIVFFNEEEVYRAACYEGASCRNPAGSADAVIGYEEGTLRWSVYEPRELELIDDPETGCRDFFCDECRCTCERLCVDVSEVIAYDFVDTYSGEIANTAYQCDPPVWEGTVGNFDLSLALARDEYGRCVIVPTVDGVEQAPVLAPGCANMTSTIVLEGGSQISVRCKLCDCAETIGDCICGRPLGPTVTLLWSSGNGTHGSAPREFTLTYGTVNEPQITCSPYPPGTFPAYSGSVSGTFPLPMGGTRTDTLYVMMVCCIGCPTCVYYRWQGTMDAGDDTWNLTYILTQDCNCPAILGGGDFSANDTWGYQVQDFTIFEEASNCA